MDKSPGIIIENLKKEERYKRLEHDLQIACSEPVEQIQGNEVKNCSVTPMWPSVSTIYSEGYDTTSIKGKTCLQVSRNESDIVSSSTNLRKIFPIHKNSYKDQTFMVTSSVKKFPNKDPLLMPPPSLHNQVFYNAKSTSNVNSNCNKEDENITKQALDDLNSDSSKRVSTVFNISHENKYLSTSNDQSCMIYRVFSYWRVILSKQGHLIIKGTLQCGKVARSKPVLYRILSNKVQSIYGQIYFLHGNLIDEKCELPDYIRGKFYNGFPDDWENVHQLWKTYVSDGCPVTFRWPTRTTDSDDDLNSDITEITFCKYQQSQYDKSKKFTKSISNNLSMLNDNSKLTLENRKFLENSMENNNVLATPEIHDIKKEINDARYSSEMKYYRMQNIESNKNTTTQDINMANTQKFNSDAKNASYLHDIIQEDKVRIILTKIGDKNCPSLYLDKFIELIDCLKYLLSYTTINNNERDIRYDISSSSNQIRGCQNCNNTPSFSESNNIQNKNGNMKLKENENSYKQTDQYVQSHPDANNEIANSSSNSDTYMGIPKASLNHLLIAKVQNSKRNKNLKNGKKNTFDRGPQIQKQVKSVQDQKLFSDSCMSISENEYENCEEQQCNQYVKYKSPYKKNNCKPTHITNESQNKYINVIQQTAMKKKPVIKSCKPVYFNLKSKNVVKKNLDLLDISGNDDRVSEQNKMLSNSNKIIYNHHEYNQSDNEDKFNEQKLHHPFLTYDSEDFENEDELNNYLKLQTEKVDNRTDNIILKYKENKTLDDVSKQTSENKFLSLPEKKTISLNYKIAKNGPFGSKHNPKLLMSWMPYVVYNNERPNEYNLKFKGKLLNEAGHIIHKKFITESIYQRHSLKLVETVNNEYFMLVGEFTNRNRIVPKELLKQCCSGCPTKVKAFCQEWIKYKSDTIKSSNEDKSINLSNNTINGFIIPTSSRGRRIIPPLNYWHGERISIKDFDTVYDPGNIKEASLLKKSKMVHEISGRNNLNEISDLSRQKFLRNDIKTRSSIKKASIKRRVLNDSSSSFSSNPDSGKEYQPKFKKSIPIISNYTRKLRKRDQSIGHFKEIGDNKTKIFESNPTQFICTYEKREYIDVLSEDQASLKRF